MDKKWWKESVFYEIYMPSFKDGNNDGIGDFKGITSKLSYLSELGIKGIWLTPFYPSPKVDNGYDISDYYNIDKDYGTLDDFKEFIKKAHGLGIKVIIDMILNHTSSEHPWFKESRSSKDNEKRDFYIWRKEKINNWESFFGGEAWEIDDVTKEYYYHAFAKEQVDLNWTNPNVYKAMKDVLKYWIDLGIDGFRLDVINFLKVNKNLNKDNPYDQKGEQIHIYDKDQEGIIEVIETLVKDIREMKEDVFIVGEVGSEELSELKNYSGKELLDVVFNFNLGSMNKFSIEKIYKEIKLMNMKYESDQIPTIFFNSHDMGRSTSRFNKNKESKGIEKAVAALLLTSYGVPFMYFGEEIGMQDLVCFDINKMNDIQGITKYNIEILNKKTKEVALVSANKSSRDKSRSPMQWDNSKFYGFSDSLPWINIDDRKDEASVENCYNSKGSLLKVYQELIKIRNNNPCLLYGTYRRISLIEDVLILERTLNAEIIRITINFSSNEYKESFVGKVLYCSKSYKKEVKLKQFDFSITNIAIK
ncbi:alpha-glucosidase [Clostridium gasigenes]|uniref:alpha-glucosidase n=1 Tax=Clostridium gasigenes TaxID=94869 RepID=UPI0014386326|nr:alpha-glucosidase [Clostridium gasigenes]MBB6622095.1 alpha-glucosidase [Clostridium gasigenes]MBU3086934.1 alpha-glucosidase [Clostridium gasigenes]NKF08147.1 alpha-glucosidase [Clostridium gasigenes]QSW18502.1 alpha-glucosidase [Clostridium gasigenes]